jgi:peptidoglycan hydrolase CwlO-like protein
MNEWQLLVALFAVCSAILAPTLWYFRSTINRLDAKDMASKSEHNQSLTNLWNELKSFRDHFDNKISDTHSVVDSKNKELKELVSSEIEFVLKNVSEIERKLDSNKEHSHQIEKDLLRLQAKVGKDYITKEDLEFIMKRYTEK